MKFQYNGHANTLHGPAATEECNLDDARAANHVKIVSFRAAAMLRYEKAAHPCEHCLPDLPLDDTDAIDDSTSVAGG